MIMMFLVIFLVDVCSVDGGVFSGSVFLIGFDVIMDLWWCRNSFGDSDVMVFYGLVIKVDWDGVV